MSLKRNKNVCLDNVNLNNKYFLFIFCLFFIFVGVIIGRFSVDNVNSSMAADKVEVFLGNISKASYNQFSDSTTVGQMRSTYEYRRIVARSMLEWQINNVCGVKYHDDYDNLTAKFWELYESCDCK